MKIRSMVTIAGILLASSVWAQWTIHTIDAANAGQGPNGLVIADDGTAHAFYHRSLSFENVHAQWTASGWEPEVVASSVGDRLTGTVDPTGRPHMFYDENCQIIHAVRTSGVWSKDTVFRLTTAIWFYLCSDTDTSGNPHLVAYQWNPNAPKALYHFWYDPDSSRWRREQLAGIVGAAAMVMDDANRVYVTYYQNQSLYLLVMDGQSRVTYHVDTEGDVGGYPSVRVSPDGSVGISYYDATNGDLKYAVGTPTGK
jgi:hypothetical protein